MRPLLVLSVASGALGSALEAPYSETASSALLERLQLYASYAAASYCKSNNDSPGKQLTCYINQTEENSCTDVHEKSDIKTLWEFENIEPGDVTGFIAADETRKEIVLAFRGSKSKSNWRTNNKFTLKDWKPICEKCRVHRGFLEAYEAVRPKLLEELKKARAKYADYALVLTGHSLGGAMATVAATSLRGEPDLKELGKDLKLYTYGAPKVGNPALISEIEGHGNKNFRVTKGSDPVPHVPIDAGTRWHFRQFFPQYHIQGDELTGLVKVENLQICMEAKPCHVNWNIQKWQPHGWYFLNNRLSACSPPVDASDEKKGSEKEDANPLQPEIPPDR